MITCKVEKFDEALPWIEPLIDEHWAEVGSFRDRFTRHIHYDEYRLLEKAERLVVVTARSESEPIVGYFIGMLGRDIHRNSLSRPDQRVIQIAALVWYMVPEYRGYARSLIRFVERYAVTTYNAQVIQIRVKPDANNASAFLELLGYRLFELTYTRLLGEASDERFQHREKLGSTVA